MVDTLRLYGCVLIGLGFLVPACGGKPKAQAVCAKLEAAGAAANCRAGKPTGVYSTATEVAEFDVPELPGKGGVVLTFDQAAVYDNTVRSYSELGSRNADHRYGKRERLVFVAINEAAPAETADKAKAVVEGL